MIMINILLLLSLYAFAEFFDAILKQADSVTKTNFNDKLKRLNQKINSNKTKHLLVENELKNLKTFDSIYILEVKAILKKMVHKIIYYLNQCTNILKGLLLLVVVIIFIFGNLTVCLIKILQRLLQVTITSIHN